MLNPIEKAVDPKGSKSGRKIEGERDGVSSGLVTVVEIAARLNRSLVTA